MASENRMEVYMGFRLMTHLFAMMGATMNDRSRYEFIDQATAAMCSNDYIVKQAARSALERYASCGEAQSIEVQHLLGENS